jgi:hypothetical protein
VGPSVFAFFLEGNEGAIMGKTTVPKSKKDASRGRTGESISQGALPGSPGRIFDTTGAAAFCHFAKHTFEKLRSKGGGPRFILASRKKVLYFERDLLDWLWDRRRTSTSDPGPAGIQNETALSAQGSQS